MSRWLLALALVGCGRLGFDPAAGPGTPDAPGAVAWQLVQSAGRLQDSLPVTLGAGHLVVVAVDVQNGGTASAVSDGSDCNTYVEIPAARAQAQVPGSSLNDNLQVFYAKNTCAHAGTITVTPASDVVGIAAWEVSGMRTDNPVDTMAVLTNQPRSVLPLGPAITTSEAGEFVVSAAIVDNNICETASGKNSPPPCQTHPGNEFTNDQALDGNGYAHLTDPHAAAGVHQAAWDQLSSGVYCATAVAFRPAR